MRLSNIILINSFFLSLIISTEFCFADIQKKCTVINVKQESELFSDEFEFLQRCVVEDSTFKYAFSIPVFYGAMACRKIYNVDNDDKTLTGVALLYNKSWINDLDKYIYVSSSIDPDIVCDIFSGRLSGLVLNGFNSDTFDEILDSAPPIGKLFDTKYRLLKKELKAFGETGSSSNIFLAEYGSNRSTVRINIGFKLKSFWFVEFILNDSGEFELISVRTGVS